MDGIIRRLHGDERGLSTLEKVGIAAAILTLLVLIPQVRAAIDWGYETLVGKNNVGPDGEPQPGVLMRGIIVGVGSLAVFVGSVFLLTFTNLGKRLAFLVTGATFFGFMAMVGLLYTMYAPRGLRPTLLEGLNAFEVKILPGALMLASFILFVMFVAAMSRYDAERAESE
jgi:hypothetical protein